MLTNNLTFYEKHHIFKENTVTRMNFFNPYNVYCQRR